MPDTATERQHVKKSRRSGWLWSRRGVQLLVLLLILWSIIQINITSLAASNTVLAHRYLQLDPLLALTAVIASAMQKAWPAILPPVLFAIPVLLVTVLFGRVFCGWLCPVGTCIDASDRLIWRRKKNQGNFRLHWLKYALLTAFVVTAIFGSQLLYVFDPISLFTRTVVVFLFPLLSPLLVHTHVLSSDTASTMLGFAFRGNLIVGLFFLAVLMLGYFGRRFWCRSLCPLGALLGLVSRLGIFRRNVGAACTTCGSCAKRCRMAAIPDGPSQHAGECTLCGECAAVCPSGSVTVGRHGQRAGSEEPADLSRRRFALAAVAGLAWAGTMATSAMTRMTQQTGRVANESLLRPPSALPEQDFLAKCMHCDACMKACPTGGLQPALTEAGLEGLLTPVLVPRLGECSVGCNACSQVCPTHAIQPFAPEDKAHIYIGTARIDHSACLMWQDSVNGKRCLVCDEHCPYDAIYVGIGPNGRKVPYVNEALCIGCGTCEHGCPVGPQAAIRVLNEAPFGDKRQRSGKEQQAWQQRMAPMYPSDK